MKKVFITIITSLLSLLVLTSCGKTTTTTIKTMNVVGQVKNINDGGVKNVNVDVNGTTGTTDKDGKFSIDLPETTDDFTVTIKKNTYHQETYHFPNNVRDFGVLNLSYSASSTLFKIGGERGINSFTMQFYRTLTGIRVEGYTFDDFSGSEKWVELVFSLDPTHIVRNANEVQLYLKADSTYVVNNFADGTFKSDGLSYSIKRSDSSTGIYLDIPYEWLGINPKDTIGIAGGVRSLDENNNEDWSGLIFDNKEINPEKPTTFVHFDKNNLLFSQSNEGIYININGRVTDSNNAGLKDVSVFVDGELVASTNSEGNFTIRINKPFGNFELSFQKIGYKDNSITALISDYPTNESEMTYTISLEKDSDQEVVTLTGSVKNIIDGYLKDVVVSSGSSSTLTEEDGSFTLNVLKSSDNNYEVMVQKDGYSTETHTYNAEISTDLGLLNISYKLHEVPFVVGGKNSTYQFVLTFTRTLNGITVIGTTNQTFDTADHWVELVVGTKEPMNTKSANDVQMFLYGNGTTGVSSQGFFPKAQLEYTVNQLSKGSEFVLNMPYSWLGIEPTETIGFAAGSAYEVEGVEGITWDGTAFEGSVEALSPITYVRFNKVNELYRALENEPLVILSGKAEDSLGNGVGGVSIIRNKTILGTTSSDGTYMISIAKPISEYTLTFNKLGYEEKNETVSKDNFETGAYVLNETLSANGGTIDLTGYTSLGNFSTQNGFPNFEAYITRDSDGIRFVFIGDDEIFSTNDRNHIELFMSTEETSTEKESKTRYQFGLYKDGHFQIINYGGGGNESSVVGMDLRSITDEEGHIYLIFTVPYQFLSQRKGAIDFDENTVVGIALGTWMENIHSWNGWTYEGVNVNADDTTDYVRIGKDSIIFRNNVNDYLEG